MLASKGAGGWVIWERPDLSGQNSPNKEVKYGYGVMRGGGGGYLRRLFIGNYYISEGSNRQNN